MKYISEKDIRALCDVDEVMEAMKMGFMAYSRMSNTMGQRFIVDLGNGNTATVIGPGILPDIPAYTMKVNSKFPQENPALKGVVTLFDKNTGEILAQFHSGGITSIRTGLSAALASDALATGTDRLAIIGAGTQNMLQLEYLMHLRAIHSVDIYDTDLRKMEEFVNKFKDRVVIYRKDSIMETVRGHDLILIATWSKTPLVDLEHVSATSHITTLGADQPGKVEVTKNLVARSKLLVDDIPLNLEMGTPGNLGCPRSSIHGTIAEVYGNPKLQSRLRHERTLYSPVGLAFQDLVLCWNLYQKAILRR